MMKFLAGYGTGWKIEHNEIVTSPSWIEAAAMMCM